MTNQISKNEKKYTLLEVLPGIFQLRLPLAFDLGHSNTFLIRDKKTWFVYDAGYSSPEAEAIWSELLDNELSDGISRLFISHHHADHMGNARWLESRTGCQIYMPAQELLCAKAHHAADAREQMLAFFSENGMSLGDATKITERYPLDKLLSPLPKQTETIVDGDIFNVGDYQFQVMLLGGHSDAQAVLFEKHTKAALLSDHLLQFITPNISLWPYGDQQPLSHYLESLDTLIGLDISAVLPGHHRVYRAATERAKAIKSHHFDMLQQVQTALTDSMNAYEVSVKIFGDIRFVLHKMLAQLEVLSHLKYLADEGHIEKSTQSVIHWQPKKHMTY